MYTTTKQGNVLFQGTFTALERKAVEEAQQQSDAIRAQQDLEMAAKGYVFSHETIWHDEVVREYRKV